MIKRNRICIKTAEYVLLNHKNLKMIQKMVYFLHFFQKGVLLAKSVNNSRFCSKVSFFRSNSKNQAIGVSIWNFAWSVFSPKGMEAQLRLTVQQKSEISGHPSQPSDCIWSLWFSSGVCVGMYELTFTLWPPRGKIVPWPGYRSTRCISQNRKE